MKREFLMLAQKYNPLKQTIAGWYLSEKLDGMRVFWDGGVSKGLLASEVPWANTEKDARYVTPPTATGLWSRYGNVIHAPDWWIDHLPKFPLDGELYMGVNSFQRLCKTVKTLVPGQDWNYVRFLAFDIPNPVVIFSDGEIKTTNFKKIFTGVRQWYDEHNQNKVPVFDNFEAMTKFLYKEINGGQTIDYLTQIQLPFSTKEAEQVLNTQLEYITNMGGEGVMLRRSMSMWKPERSHSLLKLKKLQDSEGIVVGYKWGEETDKGSKLLGMMGSLRVKWSGKEFDLSGFTDEERTILSDNAFEALEEGAKNPGKRIDTTKFRNPRFPIGSIVTFRYRDLTEEGAPKEAKYWRKATI